MEPMFLPDVEAQPQPGPWADSIQMMKAAGKEYPQIWHLFAFRPEATGEETGGSASLGTLIAAWPDAQERRRTVLAAAPVRS